ncbi:MAG: TonB-dependent receptor [Erythrobacter sp.]
MKRPWLNGAALAAPLVMLGWSGAAAAQDDKEFEYEPRLDAMTIAAIDFERCGKFDCSEPILVTASRSENVDIGDYAGSGTLLTNDQLQKRQTREVADILRDVPGVAVTATAGQTQIRLRGSEGNHVLVMVDGIEVSDPFAGEFDVGTLQAEIGSSIEVLRGPQSALYGSDAIGGVVAYRGASGADVGGFSARVEAGSFGTLNGSARVGIGDYETNLSLNATIVSTDGTPNSVGGTRNIGKDSYTLSGKGEVAVTESLTFRAAGRYIQTEGDFNDQDFNPASPTLGFVVDTPDATYENEAIYALVGAHLNLLGGDWTHDLSGQIADVTRDTFNAGGRSSGSKGQRLKASYVSSYRLDSRHNLTFAADLEREEFRNRDPFGFAFTGTRSARNIGLVGEYRFDGDAFDASAAIRHDFSNRFDDATTFKLSAGYRITGNTRFRAAVGSGIKNPGFFELFGFFDGSFIGNPNLDPEKSTEWEVGVDQDIGAVRLSVTYFDAELENEIFTSFPAPTFIATPDNRDTKSTRRGVELSAQANFGQFAVHGAYSYLNAKENGVREVRRPKHLASASLNWEAPNEAASAGITVRHNGQTEDFAFTLPSFAPVDVTLDDYTLVNLYGELRITDQIRAFGRIENVLDEEYTQVFSFVTQGRSAIIGISAEF